MSDAGSITVLLSKASAGDRDAAGRLFPLVYGELRTLAQRAMRRERAGHTLQSTALVHEVYVRLLGDGVTPARERTHFFALASQAIRRILVDHARQKARLKRGGPRARVALPDDVPAPPDPAHGNAIDMVALDTALDDLRRGHPRKADVVEMRFFGGMTAQEAADVLGTTTRTVERDWQFARAWLFRELREPVLERKDRRA